MTKISLPQQVLRTIGHQLWLPGRDRILRAFSNPDTQKSHPFEIEFFGMPYVGDLSNFIDWTVFYSGAFVPHELRLLQDLAAGLRAKGKAVNFFDVGANIGHHTLFMSHKADRIFAFEPFEVVLNQMKRKLEHAGIRNVTIFPVALGEDNETGTYRPPTGANQGTGTLTGAMQYNSAEETISVTVVGGDDFLTVNNLPPISLLKMDVEGYELNVLKGLKQTLRRDRPPILVEIKRENLTGSSTQTREAMDDLVYPNHLVFTIDSTRDGRYFLLPFSDSKSDEALVLPEELADILPVDVFH